MKRVIKYWNKHESNGINFSDCSTEYEILPLLIADDAGAAELTEIARSLELDALGDVQIAEPSHRALHVTHAVQVGIKTVSRQRETETYPIYLGLIALPEGPLEPMETIDNSLTAAQITTIIDGQHYGVDAVGATVDGATVLVKSGWHYFHCLPLLGYSRGRFEYVLTGDDYEESGIPRIWGIINPSLETGFWDDTYQCMSCGLWDARDDGRTTNFRELGGELLGVNCGCYDEACTDQLDVFVNDASRCIELNVAESLEEAGTLEHVERYIGGMTDGRGGRYAGQATREGRPEAVLAELLKEDPEGRFIFSLDESGQFQLYFSVWKLVS